MTTSSGQGSRVGPNQSLAAYKKAVAGNPQQLSMRPSETKFRRPAAAAMNENAKSQLGQYGGGTFNDLQNQIRNPKEME